MSVNGRINEEAVREKYFHLTASLIKNKITITTMESCTSGQVASLLTDTEGASAIMKGACITYSNEAKIMEGVPGKTIDRYGVYSSQTAAAMALSCQKKYGADIGVGITGSFGNPDPNNEDSVPGQVFFAIAVKGREQVLTASCSIPAQDSRLDYKLFVADVVADALEDILLTVRN